MTASLLFPATGLARAPSSDEVRAYEGLVTGTASRNETGAIELSDHFKLRMRQAATDDLS